MKMLPFFVLILFALQASSAQSDNSECSEASDFIKNAAISRDNGLDKQTFVNKLLEDLEAIKAFPPSLRFFAQTPQDEDFLIYHTRIVFERPDVPENHQKQFLEACLKRK